MAIKVSILTPIYNVEKYLPECLDSLVAQTIQEVEFICVNDGSTDSCLQILTVYAHMDPRFKIIDQPNAGYGAAMNISIDAAQGDYVGILEADDYAEPDAFERLYSLASSCDADIAKSNFHHYDEASEHKFCNNYPEDICERPLGKENALECRVPRHEVRDENQIATNTAVFTHDAFVHYHTTRSEASRNSRGKVFCICNEFASVDEYRSKRNLPEKLVESLHYKRKQPVQQVPQDRTANRPQAANSRDIGMYRPKRPRKSCRKMAR